jgi:glycine C-acetyltransferase
MMQPRTTICFKFGRKFDSNTTKTTTTTFLNFKQRYNNYSTNNNKGKQQFKEILQQELVSIQEAGTYKKERIIVSPQSSSIYVKNNNKAVLNFCANNYLGLANNAEVKEAAKKAIDTHGNGLSSVRFICGTQDIHKDLENQVAMFHGKEDSIIFPSCFDANAGIFETLLTKDDAVLSDELNHASIIDGIRLCKAKRYRYKHLDLSDLEVRFFNFF